MQDIEQRAILNRLSARLDTLPPLCRLVFCMVRFDELNDQQVAAALGMSPRKVRRFVQRAFAACQREIEMGKQEVEITTVSDPQPRYIEGRPVPRLEMNDERWSVWLDADTTMLELIALMGGLRLCGMEVEATHVGEGVFCLRPLLPHAPPPSAVMLVHCQALGGKLAELPGLRMKGAT